MMQISKWGLWHVFMSRKTRANGLREESTFQEAIDWNSKLESPRMNAGNSHAALWLHNNLCKPLRWCKINFPMNRRATRLIIAGKIKFSAFISWIERLDEINNNMPEISFWLVCDSNERFYDYECDKNKNNSTIKNEVECESTFHSRIELN